MFGLGFLNQIFLFALGASLIPVLIHLLNRRRVRKVHFSSLKFIEEISRRRMRKINLRRIIVLILRTLAVLFLVIAFARPVLKGGAGFFLPGKAPVSVVLCIDNSFSMGAELEEGTVFSRAKEIAKEVINQCGDKDLFNIIPFSSWNDVVFENGTYDRDLVKASIEKLKLSEGATDMAGALRRAVAVVGESKLGNGEIYVISDFMGSRDSSFLPDDLGRIKVVMLPVYNKAVDNAGIDRVSSPRKLIRPGEVIRVSVLVTNHSRDNEADFPVEIVVDGKRKAEKQVTLSPASSAGVNFAFSLSKGGVHHCIARKSRDRLPQDDERRFLLEVSKSIPVLIVKSRQGGRSGVRSEGDFYVATALNPARNAEAEFDVKSVSERAVTAFDLQRAGVLAWNDPAGKDGKRARLLIDYVKSGGAMVVFLGEGMKKLSADRSFMDFIGASGAIIKEEDKGEGLKLFRAGHPALGLFKKDELELLSRAKIRRYVSVRVNHPDSVLAYLENGDPFMWECSRGEGRAIVFASTPDLDHGDLPLSPMFLPLMHTTTSYLANVALADLHREGYVGQRISFDLPRGFNVVPSSLAINRDGYFEAKPMLFRLPSGEVRVAYDSPKKRGFYALLSDSDVISEAVVNLDPAESRLSAMKLGGKAGARAIVLDTGENLVSDLKIARQGREIFAFFLLLSIAALVAESLLGRKA